jgi:hypothetical protein
LEINRQYTLNKRLGGAKSWCSTLELMMMMMMMMMPVFGEIGRLSYVTVVLVSIGYHESRRRPFDVGRAYKPHI